MREKTKTLEQAAKVGPSKLLLLGTLLILTKSQYPLTPFLPGAPEIQDMISGAGNMSTSRGGSFGDWKRAWTRSQEPSPQPAFLLCDLGEDLSLLWA